MPMNMSYCRFQNTLQALRECVDALDGINWAIEELGSDENYAARQLLRLCQQVAVLGEDLS